MGRCLDFNPLGTYIDPNSIEGRLHAIREERRRIQAEAPVTPTIQRGYIGEIMDVDTPFVGEYASHSPRYEKYLRSDQWKSRKRRLAHLVGYRCQVCETKFKRLNLLHLHHITYERLFNERDEDLLILCEICHGGWHQVWGHGKKFYGEPEELIKALRKRLYPMTKFKERRLRTNAPDPTRDTSWLYSALQQKRG